MTILHRATIVGVLLVLGSCDSSPTAGHSSSGEARQSDSRGRYEIICCRECSDARRAAIAVPAGEVAASPVNVILRMDTETGRTWYWSEGTPVTSGTPSSPRTRPRTAEEYLKQNAVPSVSAPGWVPAADLLDSVTRTQRDAKTGRIVVVK